MSNITKWIRPWNVEKFDGLARRDERFFAILTKGFLSWLNTNIILYNKAIPHFIFNTGSSYLYIENNGYEFSMNETSGEDGMYNQMPRCIVVPGTINIPTEELTSNFAHCQYERYDEENNIKGYNSQFKRMPINWDFNLTYIFSNYNESIIVVEELINKIIFQKYFNINYLGQIIKCSIEMSGDFNIELNKIDMTNPDVNQRTIAISVKVCSNYPVIDERSEVSNGDFVCNFTTSTSLENGNNLSNYAENEDKKLVNDELPDIQKEMERDINNPAFEESEIHSQGIKRIEGTASYKIL